MIRIDAHQHFWHYNPQQHSWMNDSMAVLRRDYLPGELAPLLQATGIDGTIAVQARQSVEETDWLLGLAGVHDQIKGVVGWLDLRAADLRQQIETRISNPKFVGLRHIVQDEPDDQFLLLPAFRQGIAVLAEFDLPYDLLLFPRHLPVAVQLVAAFPRQPFVLDHLGKPAIGQGQLSPWREHLQQLARFPNVHCKLSGMVTEAKWKQWRPEDLRPYLDIVLEAFGPERVMIGSDWPVCLLSADYPTTLQIVFDCVQQFPPAVREAILGGNCARFYRLESKRGFK